MIEAPPLAQEVARAQRELVIAPHDLGPSAVDDRREELQRGGDGKPRRRIERAGPVELEVEAAAVAALRVRAMADDRRAHRVAAVRMDVEKRGALRRANPLVQVAGVEGNVERAEVERQHTRSM